MRRIPSALKILAGCARRLADMPLLFDPPQWPPQPGVINDVTLPRLLVHL